MWLSAYKTSSISETAEDRAKVTTNCLHEVAHDLLIIAKMYDLVSGLEVRRYALVHFFDRLEIIPPLLSGRLPYRYAVCR